MALLLLEALAVLGIAIFIVWWTMFAGRPKRDASESGADGPRAGDPVVTASDVPKGGGAARGSGDSTGSKPG